MPLKQQPSKASPRRPLANGWAATSRAAKPLWPTHPLGQHYHPGPSTSPRPYSSSSYAGAACCSRALPPTLVSRRPRSAVYWPAQACPGSVIWSLRNPWFATSTMRPVTCCTSIPRSSGASFGPVTASQAIGAIRPVARGGRRCSWPLTTTHALPSQGNPPANPVR